MPAARSRKRIRNPQSPATHLNPLWGLVR